MMPTGSRGDGSPGRDGEGFQLAVFSDGEIVPLQVFRALTGQAGQDGGLDLVLRKDGDRILVQCKKYVRDPVGVSLLREFFGVVVSEGANRGIFITTSDFTPDAREFGFRHANLELIP